MSKNLLGIMQLDTKVKITTYTTFVKTTFKVTDNGATVYMMTVQMESD